MTPRERIRWLFGPTLSSRVQVTVGLILYIVLTLISLNDPWWGGPWEGLR